MTTYLSLNGCPSGPWTFLPKQDAGGGSAGPHTGLFTELSLSGTPGGIHTFLPKTAPVTTEIECNIYFDLTCDFGLGRDVPVLTIPGKDILWCYLRRQGTIELPSRERTLDFLRSQITFYRDFIMANQDPFEVSKGGKLVAQRIFLNPLRVVGDEISGTPTTSQSQDDFIVDNIEVNTVDIVNEDGATFPEGTVIQFDVEAPGSLGVDLGYDEVLLYFNFISLAGLELRISHPLRVVDSVEVR